MVQNKEQLITRLSGPRYTVNAYPETSYSISLEEATKEPRDNRGTTQTKGVSVEVVTPVNKTRSLGIEAVNYPDKGQIDSVRLLRVIEYIFT